MNPYDLYPDFSVTDQFGNFVVNEPSRAQLSLPPQPPQSKNTGVKAGAEAALMFADDLLTPAAQAVQKKATSLMGTGVSTKVGPLASISRFAASPAALTAAKVGTGISALGGVLGAADVLVGQDSAANKVMDTAAMGIGGFLGAAGGPVGIAAGAGIGKTISDGAQWLFGDKKTAEQRRMEEALAALRGGRI